MTLLQEPPGHAPCDPVQQADMLRLFAGLFGLHADTTLLHREFGDEAGDFGLAQAAQALQALGLEPVVRRGPPSRARRGPSPLLAQARDGRLLVAVPATSGGWLVQGAGESGPQPLDDATLAALWGGRWLTVPRPPGAGTGEEAPAQRFGLAWFLKALRPHRGVLAEVLLASLLVQLLALATPLVFQVVIDKVLTQRTPSTLDVLVLGLLAIGVFEVLLGLVRHYLSSHTAQRLDAALGARVFRHLLRLPLAYFDSRRPADTAARLRELENVRAFLTGPALGSGLDLAFVFVFLGVMAQYSPLLAAVVAGSLPVFALLSWGLAPMLRRELDDKHALGAENQAFLAEAVGAIETLKSQALEPAWQRSWERRLSRQVRTAFHAGQVAQATQQSLALASRLLTVALLWLGSRAVLAGDLTVGGLIAFNMLASRVHAPVLKLASLWQDVVQLRVSIRRLAEVMDVPPEPALALGRALPPPLRGEVRFEAVGFRYAPALPPVLDGFHLQVRPGEVVALAGGSGVGKTTALRLLQRLHAPQAGRILVDGHDIALMDPAWLRRQVGVVPQEPVLFHLTVRENIAAAHPGLPMERVVDAARAAGAHDFILRLPQGYDTPVGERGARLSGGQRARVAIARALVGDPAVLLLDEPSAWLDDTSEQKLFAQLREWCARRSVILVAHRPSTLRLAHRVVVMDRAGVLPLADAPRGVTEAAHA